MKYLLVLLCLSQAAFGIARHIDNNPNNIPNQLVVGRWLTNASYVVVAPNWIITTCHQGGSPTTLTINSIDYTCTYDPAWKDSSRDIRLVRLLKADGMKANLPYTPIYTKEDEVGKIVCVGGYGIGVADNLVNVDGIHYGYALSTANGNSIQRFCNNRVDFSTSFKLYAYFDALDSIDYVADEGMPTLWDSGGGWFIYDDGWKLAGLSQGIETHGTFYECWFKNKYSSYFDPDSMTAIRISANKQWIQAILATDSVTDLSNDGITNLNDVAILQYYWKQTAEIANDWCAGSDIDRSGVVDMDDAVIIALNWLQMN